MHAYENYKKYGTVEDCIEWEIAEQRLLEQIPPEPRLGLLVKTCSSKIGSGNIAQEIQASLQLECEPALAQNVKEMQQHAIHLRHPGCRLANRTSKGVDDMLSKYIVYNRTYCNICNTSDII